MGRWLIDGMNVIGSRPDGWWRDRDAAARRLAGQLAAWAEIQEAEVTLVLDGRPFDLEAAGAIEIAFPPRGQSADDEIARRAAADPANLVVVTSDAELAGRVRAAGAEVTGAGAFRTLLEADARA